MRPHGIFVKVLFVLVVALLLPLEGLAWIEGGGRGGVSIRWRRLSTSGVGIVIQVENANPRPVVVGLSSTRTRIDDSPSLVGGGDSGEINWGDLGVVPGNSSQLFNFPYKAVMPGRVTNLSIREPLEDDWVRAMGEIDYGLSQDGRSGPSSENAKNFLTSLSNGLDHEQAEKAERARNAYRAKVGNPSRELMSLNFRRPLPQSGGGGSVVVVLPPDTPTELVYPRRDPAPPVDNSTRLMDPNAVQWNSVTPNNESNVVTHNEPKEKIYPRPEVAAPISNSDQSQKMFDPSPVQWNKIKVETPPAGTTFVPLPAGTPKEKSYPGGRVGDVVTEEEARAQQEQSEKDALALAQKAKEEQDEKQRAREREEARKAALTQSGSYQPGSHWNGPAANALKPYYTKQEMDMDMEDDEEEAPKSRFDRKMDIMMDIMKNQYLKEKYPGQSYADLPGEDKVKVDNSVSYGQAFIKYFAIKLTTNNFTDNGIQNSYLRDYR